MDGEVTMTSTTATDSETTGPTRVVIVDDHDVVALGLRALLDDVDDIEVVASAGSVAAAAEVAERLRPDVMLMDYRLPDGTGAEATRRIREGSSPPMVVMVTSAADRRVLGEALEAGCTGFVSKNADRDDLVAAIRAAAANDSYFTRDVLNHLVHLKRFDQLDDQELTARECEVLQATAEGLNPNEIAQRLYLSPHTVKNHLRHAMSKLDAHTKLEAVVKALRARLISIDE
jgi:DNA-binding NarL/FixJ family response regulator